MKRRSIFQFLVTSFLVAVLTASCGLFGTTDTPQSTTGTKSPVASTEVVKIGAILPLTGTAAYLGEGERFGMQLALEEFPELKQRVKFIFEDSKGKPETAVTSARKLLDFENVGIHAVSTTGAVLATLPVYKQSNKDVLVFAQSMMPELTKGYPFAYRIYATADEEMKLLSQYSKKQKYLRIGTLNVTNRAGDEASKILQENINKYGGKVEIAESVVSTEKDFRNVLGKFKEKNLDAIMIYAFTTGYPNILQQMEEVGLKIPVLGNLQFAVGGFEKQVSSDMLKRVVFPASRYYIAKDDPKIQKFDQKVKSAGKEANHDIAYFYDMTNILLRAIQQSPSQSPKDVASSILKLMPYQGVTGKIDLNSERDNQAAMTLVRWTDKGIEAI